MNLNSISKRLLLFIGASFIVTFLLVLYLADKQFTAIVDASQQAVYAEKLESVIKILDRKYERLLATHMVAAYQEDFKDSALKELEELYYTSQSQNIYPIILDKKGSVLMHPFGEHEEKKLSNAEFIKAIIAQKEGSLQYTCIDGIEKWSLFKQFLPWDWVVAYSVPSEIKYKDILQFRRSLVLILSVCLLLVLFLLCFIVSRFTKPIVTLTDVASQMSQGSLDVPIDIDRKDEVGVLARSFAMMRISIWQQIADLGEANRKLQLEIGERKSVESALRESEERFKGLVANIPGATYRCLNDRQRTMQFISKTIEEISGYPPAYFIDGNSGSYASLVHPDDLASVQSEISEALNIHEDFALDYRIIDADGKERWVTDRGRGVFNKDGNILNIDGVVFDVTQRKNNEKQLARLAQAIEQGAEEIIISDSNGLIEYVNPAFERISGYSRSEAFGKNLLFMEKQVHDEVFCRKIWKTVKGGRVWRGRLNNVIKGGNRIVVETTLSPVFDSLGKNMGFVSIKRDVTEQIKVEERMRQTQKMEAIGTLAGGIAHDFNNILHGIIGYSELAIKDLLQVPVPLRRVERILDAATRAKDLVSQILTFSRQKDIKKKSVQVTLIFKEALKLLRPSIPSSIKIKQNLVSDLSVMADPTQIHQIFMNLCTNALYAMKETGGTLEVNLTEVDLAEDFTNHYPDIKPGRFLQLSVKDTGCGISQEVKERIFEPFFTSKPEGEGTGLGLSTVHGIVASLGGAITVETEPGVGSTFTVFMPVFEGKEDSSRTEFADLPKGHERILVVDDEAFLVEMLSDMLTDLGYSVDFTCSSEEGLDIFLDNPAAIDLVLTDMTMSHLNGFELAQRILAQRPEMPIILITGYSMQINEEKARAAGIRKFLMKPVLKEELAQCVRSVLDSSHAT
ncbi:MAG: PAS domain S-box protein [Desulfobulbaceae bacterium]|nr:PAS domain S-box protein [Desulfobulbaceae bacterium]